MTPQHPTEPPRMNEHSAAHQKEETMTDVMTDAFEEATAEMLADEASAENETTTEEKPMGGLLPSVADVMGQTEMQGEGFEKPAKTRRQLAEEFLEHFQADVEKAQRSVGNANANLRAAIVLRDDAEENLRRAIREENEAPVDEEAEPEPVDPVPGQAEKSCRTCGDRCNLEQPEGMGCGGNGWTPEHDEAACVVAVFPALDEPDGEYPVATDVGEHTTYGELVADYLTADGLDEETSAYIVVDAEDGDLCPLNAQIAPEAYGRRYAVLPRAKGEVEA